MGIDASTDGGEAWHAAMAALAWQVELGVTDAIGDIAINRYDLEETLPGARAEVAARPAGVPQAARSPAPRQPDPGLAADGAVAAATSAAGQAQTLEDLRAALSAYDHCDIRKGARNLVFADGIPEARLLVLGGAPDRDEDMEGRPFAGRAGLLLDRMFAAIGHSRTSPDPGTGLYLLNVMPWRPPADRTPEPAEIAMMLPFLMRHIALADPEVIVVMGNAALSALTGTTGILRARGTWTEALGRPVLPMTHPASLLSDPASKREAWSDLLSLKARLRP